MPPAGSTRQWEAAQRIGGLSRVLPAMVHWYAMQDLSGTIVAAKLAKRAYRSTLMLQVCAVAAAVYGCAHHALRCGWVRETGIVIREQN